MRSALRGVSVKKDTRSRNVGTHETRITKSGYIRASTRPQIREGRYIEDYLHPNCHGCFDRAIRRVAETKEKYIIEADMLIGNLFRTREIQLTIKGPELFIIKDRPGKSKKVLNICDYQGATHNHYILDSSGVYIYCKDNKLPMTNPIGRNIFGCVLPEFRESVRAAFLKAYHEKALAVVDYGFGFGGKCTYHRGTFRPYQGQVSLRDIRIPNPNKMKKSG